MLSHIQKEQIIKFFKEFADAIENGDVDIVEFNHKGVFEMEEIPHPYGFALNGTGFIEGTIEYRLFEIKRGEEK